MTAGSINRHLHKCAYVVSVNMGYGHERAAFALRDLAYGGIITANDYPDIPDDDRKLWQQSRRLYEFVSRLQPIPLLGSLAFGIMDRIQKIADFYPRRDLSKATLQVHETYGMIERLDLGRHLIEKLAKRPKPLVCTFFIPAFAAEVFDYPEEIYLVVCDSDMSRAWVARDPKKSRIKYFAPNGRVVERLKLYGVPEENIFLTGFPLPKEIIGGSNGSVIKKDLVGRLCNLDPNGIFTSRYYRTLEVELGIGTCPLKPTHPLTLTFAVGGAGAQRTLALDIMKSMRHHIRHGDIMLQLSAGTRQHVAAAYRAYAIGIGLKSSLGKNLKIHSTPSRSAYFHEFSTMLRQTDILWTKPSELSFYTGVGLPIIMAPPIGSQEDFNRTWLRQVGGGVTQGDPRYTAEWLFDWVNSGGLARMAWNGYIEAPTHGSYRIESILTGEKIVLEKLPLIV